MTFVVVHWQCVAVLNNLPVVLLRASLSLTDTQSGQSGMGHGSHGLGDPLVPGIGSSVDLINMSFKFLPLLVANNGFSGNAWVHLSENLINPQFFITISFTCLFDGWCVSTTNGTMFLFLSLFVLLGLRSALLFLYLAFRWAFST